MKKKMLIVDDNQNLQEALKLVFEENYNLYFAASGEEAIVAFGEASPEVVLMDFQMPGLNGVETMKILQDQSPKTQMIIMSACEAKECTVNSISSGAFDFVTKPFDIFDLKNIVDQAAASVDKIINFSTKNMSLAERQINIQKQEIDSLIERTLQVACI